MQQKQSSATNQRPTMDADLVHIALASSGDITQGANASRGKILAFKVPACQVDNVRTSLDVLFHPSAAPLQSHRPQDQLLIFACDYTLPTAHGPAPINPVAWACLSIPGPSDYHYMLWSIQLLDASSLWIQLFKLRDQHGLQQVQVGAGCVPKHLAWSRHMEMVSRRTYGGAAEPEDEEVTVHFKQIVWASMVEAARRPLQGLVGY